jgi:outer membrane protein assembly factor BamB
MNKKSYLTMWVASFAVTASADPEWPQFRGPNGLSTAKNQNPPVELDTSKNLLWKIALPGGASSPVVAGDRIFLTGFESGRLITLAVDRKDGSFMWKHEVVPSAVEKYFEKLGSPAASTCATDGELVISYFGSHGLLCFDLDGKLLWEIKLPVTETKDGFGTGTSPVLHDGIVYLLRDEDGPGNGLYAFDAETGKEVWKQSRRDFRVSFGSPTIWNDTVAVIGDTRAKGYDLKTGKEKWLVRGLAAYPCTTPTVGADGNLYIATWSPGGSPNEPMPTFDELLKGMDKDSDSKLSKTELEDTGFKDFFSVMDKDGSGAWERPEWESNLSWMKRGRNIVLGIKPGGREDITETHVLWSNEKGAPYVASPLFYDGKLFIVKDGGLATLYEAATGKLLYDKQRLGIGGDYYVSPTLVGDRIYVGSTNGMLMVLDAKATEKPIVLAKLDLGEYLAASPAFVDNKIYIRTKETVWAFGTN